MPAWLIALSRWLLLRVVRIAVVPPAADAPESDGSAVVFYALNVRQLSAFLVLDEATRQLGLPRAAAPDPGGLGERRSFFFLTRSGQPSPLRRSPYRYSRRLARLVAAARADPGLQIRIVPVSVFFGRAPRHQDSLIKALLADSWAAPGLLQQCFRLLVHGRQTLVKFGPPLALRPMLRAGTQDLDEERDLRRVARRLRAEFRNERELAIGPNLSHRQTVVNEIVNSKPVQQAVQDEAQRAGVSIERAELGARRMAVEIAADYSYPFIRAYDIALTALWNRLYDGVEVHRFETIASAGTGSGIVYLPCHRSHIDYLLLSYVIYHRGLLPPHIAAGVNLNLPLVGGLLRRGGAFFLRRSLKGEPLYASIFSEYLHAILRRGFPIEYFVEGGRSRSGLMLPAKAGLLSMTVDSFLREPARPLVFVPVYIGYEQLIEAGSYAAELAGRPKQKESLGGLLRALLALRRRSFGKVHVAIGEPIRLSEVLDAQWPEWRETPAGRTDSNGRTRAIAALSTLVVTRINEALVINPINLFATAMLGAPAPAMDAQRLAEQIDLMRRLLQAIPYSPLQQLSALDGAQVIDYAAGQGIAVRQPHPLGDIVTVPAERAPLLTYYRNNVLHAFAEASLLACFVVQAERITEAALLDACRRMLPLLRAELFLSPDDGMEQERFQRCLSFLAGEGLIERSAGQISSPPPSDKASVAIHALARAVRQPLQRCMIVASTLDRFEPGALDAQALEGCAWLIAQRVALLGAGDATQLPDRAALRTHVETLIALGHAEERAGRLHATSGLSEVTRHAALTLPPEVRLAISHASQRPVEEILAAQAAARAGSETRPAGRRRPSASAAGTNPTPVDKGDGSHP